MPFVPPGDALNLGVVDLLALSRGLGPGTWRQPVVASAAGRAVLLHLLPGQVPHPPHRHPRADEIFIVVTGSAVFTIGDGPEFVAGPLSVAYAPADARHSIRASGPEPLLLISIVVPNSDTPDEAVDCAD